ncbi:MAG TPA: hypothetical protein VFQ13_21415 [Anaerolineales bacterium]|nr:hypothetical protein [Anaerolineales bacterium]
MFRKTIFILGGILFILSVFTQQLGLDNDAGWGTGRTAILVLALAFILIGFLASYYPDRFSKFIHALFARRHLVAAILVVTIIYVWASQVNIKYIRKDYNYYSELARGFKSGHLYLPEQPSQALLALKDPYDYNRRRVELEVEDFPWDVSLYKQKFYLYYGPLPALILSVLSNELLLQIGDRHLVIPFALGLFIYGTLIILMFFARALPNAPGWLVATCVLTFGLTAPAAIMLQESRIYQVAVFGAQFFFIGGGYWIYSALTENRLNAWKLSLAGVHWALALGTRFSIAPTILYATVVTIICIFLLYKTSAKEILIPVFSIGIPLLIAVVSLAWYNWARFDSVFEFGLRYTLSDTNYTTSNEAFSIRHIGQNFHHYFTRPLRVRAHFPYLIRTKDAYLNERLGGLLYIAPYILFALLPVLVGVRTILSRKKLPSPFPLSINPESWLLVTSAGSAIISAITVASFWTAQTRYIEDFMPSLLLFATANVALVYGTLENEVRWRKFFSFVIVLFACITIVASTLVALKTDSLSFWTNLMDTGLRILNLK